MVSYTYHHENTFTMSKSHKSSKSENYLGWGATEPEGDACAYFRFELLSTNTISALNLFTYLRNHDTFVSLKKDVDELCFSKVILAVLSIIL